MINLRNLTDNQDIIVYVNTLSADIPYSSNLFLFGFKNGFTNVYTYVIPTIIQQNSRYIRFSIELVQQQALIDPENGIIRLSPSGNYDYNLWAIDTATLDPSTGYLLDEGQAYLENTQPETVDIVYISDNDAERNIVYLTRNESECATWSSTDIWKFSNFTWNCDIQPEICTEWDDITENWEDVELIYGACT